jgi:hypothetical protein
MAFTAGSFPGRGIGRYGIAAWSAHGGEEQHRKEDHHGDQHDGGACRDVEPVACEQAQVGAECADDHADQHHQAEAVGQQRACRGRCQEHAKHQQRAHGLEGNDDGQRHQQHHQGVISPRREPGHVGTLGIEAEQQEWTGRHDGDADHRDGGHGHDRELVGAGAEDLAEQDREQVTLECARCRDHDHAQGQHGDEEQTDRRVRGESRATGHEGDAADHDHGTHGRAKHARQAQQDGTGDPGQHAVCQRIADEGHAPEYHERPDDRARDRDQHAGKQCPQHECVLGERVDEDVHIASCLGPYRDTVSHNRRGQESPLVSYTRNSIDS